MKKRGFTLIELLATIVLLAIIVLIGIPKIIDTIEKARKGAFARSIEGYIKSVHNYRISNDLENIEKEKEFYVIDGINDKKLEIEGSQNNWNGELIFNNSQQYYLYIENKKFCAYKDYTDTKFIVEKIENCDQYKNVEGVHEPIILVENEEKIEKVKSVTIDYKNSNNINEYCISDSLEKCTWINVQDRKTSLKIDKNTMVYVRSSNGDIVKMSSRKINSVGIVEDENIELTIVHVSSENSITSTVTTNIDEAGIRYYFSINNNDYIEESSPYHLFDGLEENTKYNIKIYAENLDGKKSNVYEDEVYTKESEKNPIIKSYSTSSGDYDITLAITGESYNHTTIEKYYFKIDNNDYIESSNSYYTFENLEPYVDHNISFYIKDSKGRISEIGTTKLKTNKKHSNPVITSLVSTSSGNNITIAVSTTTSDNVGISKYYYSINGQDCIESTSPAYTFTDLEKNRDHRFSVYVVDDLNFKSNVSYIQAVTESSVPYLTIVVNNQGYEIDGEMWYPYGTSVTLNFSSDMTSKTGYYKYKNEITGVVNSYSSTTSKKLNITLSESREYTIKLSDNGSESEEVTKKVNIMPSTNINANKYFSKSYNTLGNVYPVLVTASTSGSIYGTNVYANGAYISRAATHIGLVKTGETKLLRIKVVGCPSEGYVGSTINGITSQTTTCNNSYNAYEFIKDDGTSIKVPTIDSLTTTSGENSITAVITANAYNGAKIEKYYFSIDDGEYVETTNPYYIFTDVTPYVEHTIKGYTLDSYGLASKINESKAATTKEIPIPTITLDYEGYEVDGEMWYPNGTIMTIKYADDMTNLTGYYLYESLISGSKNSNYTSSTYSYRLTESYEYKAWTEDSIGRKGEVTTVRINIMPSTNINANKYFSKSYNTLGNVYPVLVTASTSGSIYGTNVYANGAYISRAATHIGLVKTGETKLLRIKVVGCPSEGYVGSTINGITSQTTTCNNSYNAYEFIKDDGTSIKVPTIDSLTTSSNENSITAVITANAYNGAKIEKYYYKLDNNDYIETTTSSYTFENLENYSEHTISSYVVDSNGMPSVVKEFKTIVGIFPPELEIIKNPGTMTSYSNQTDKVYGVIVTASNSGSLWGTEIYTADSTVAKAVIHMGLAKAGETVLVKVQILPGQSSYSGTTNNGITSSSYGSYSSSYKILGLVE